MSKNKNTKGLLPCPFCGGEAKLDDCRTIWRVCCTNCEGLILGERAPEPEDDEHCNIIDWDYYMNTAINAWNKRKVSNE
jgi:hypothetical protein